MLGNQALNVAKNESGLKNIFGLRSSAAAETIISQAVQVATGAIGSGQTSNSQTITSVDTARTVLMWAGCKNVNGGFASSMRATLASSTSVSFNLSSSGGVTNNSRVNVVEFKSGVISSVQYGTITINSGSASNTATITSVDTSRSVVGFLGMSSAANGSYFCNLALTNSTTVTASGAETGTTRIVSYVVVEFSSTYFLRKNTVTVTGHANNLELKYTNGSGNINFEKCIPFFQGMRMTSASSNYRGKSYFPVGKSDVVSRHLTAGGSFTGDATETILTFIELTAGIRKTDFQKVVQASLTQNTTILSLTDYTRAAAIWFGDAGVNGWQTDDITVNGSMHQLTSNTNLETEVPSGYNNSNEKVAAIVEFV